MGKISFQTDKFQVNAFYGKEVQIGFDVFDNEFNLFEEEATNPKLWGVYSQFPIAANGQSNHKGEIYYIGFQSDFSAFSDVVGEEKRHSIGLRSFGSINRKFQFNSELFFSLEILLVMLFVPSILKQIGNIPLSIKNGDRPLV